MCSLSIRKAIYILAITAVSMQLFGCGGDGSSNSSASDSSTPLVISTSPIADAQNVSAKTTISAECNEPMNSATLNGSTFTVSSPSGKISCEVVTTGSTTSCVPSVPLKYDEIYTVTISSSAADVSGNTIGRDFI